MVRRNESIGKASDLTTKASGRAGSSASGGASGLGPNAVNLSLDPNVEAPWCHLSERRNRVFSSFSGPCVPRVTLSLWSSSVTSVVGPTPRTSKPTLVSGESLFVHLVVLLVVLCSEPLNK